jgi:hypothetical protein
MNRAMRGADFVLWTWVVFGVLAFVCVPALRGRDAFWGWLPFWLFVAPLVDLVFLRRAELVATSRALLSRARRRRHAVRPQALRLRTRRIVRHRVRPATVSP